MDSSVTELSYTLVSTQCCELGVHRSVVNLRRLASSDSLPLSLLVHEEEDNDLKNDDNDESDENEHDGASSRRVVLGLVLGLEEQRSDNVTGGGSGVEESHNDRLLGLTSSVGNDPGISELDAIML